MPSDTEELATIIDWGWNPYFNVLDNENTQQKRKDNNDSRFNC